MDTLKTESQSIISIKRLGIILTSGLILYGLYLISRNNYLLFHGLVEVFSIVVAGGIFMVFWNSRRFLDNGYYLFIGIAYVFIGGVDLIHTLGYKGMGVFPEYDANLPTQLWIAARYLESFTLLLAPFLLWRKLKIYHVTGFYMIVTSLLLASIFFGIFPECFVEGAGLTLFKRVSEYVISMILMISIFLLYRRREFFDQDVFRLLIASIVVTIGSELSFTLYRNVYGLPNMIGHLLKIVSLYLVYKAYIEAGLTKPFTIIFKELKENEKELWQHRENLEKLVQNRTHELQQTTNELMRSNKELEQFVYVASHDLAEPLRSVISFLQLIEKRYQGRLDKEGEEFIQFAVNGAARMKRMLESLREYSTAEKQLGALTQIDTQLVIAQSLQKLKVMIDESEAKITADPLPEVIANDTQLGFVFCHLIRNAIDYRSVETPQIHVGIKSLNGEWQFSIRDNGVGIEPQYFERIFLIFKRLYSEVEQPGDGLGLATCKKIIERDGGRIWVESTPGEGSTFYFTILKNRSDQAFQMPIIG